MAQHHSFKLGQYTCTCLLDFARDRTPRATFPRIDPAELEKEIMAGGYDLDLDRPMALHGVVLLLENGDHKILIDSGLAEGQLVNSLAQAGHSPEDIDFIIITHGDGDHIGGLNNFPNATYLIPETSLQLWLKDTDGMVEEFIKLFRDAVSADALAAQAAGRRAYVDVLTAAQAAGRIQTISDRSSLPFFEGVSIISAPGHRRDHTAVRIESEGSVLLHVADAFRHPLQLKRHDFHCLFDSYPAILADTMVNLLDMAAAQDAIVFGAHFEFPAIIKINKDDNQYRWVTL